ncbi:helix-turn-helix domain-containing protein [Streptomyces sp. PSAA01]|uniref:helix-turn-helix domain-containing protein n=1 Tax=Streptomyces sp. PSAA01 TaxID=2912762 RepID=UPI001F26FD0F|nr:helix-turn-helix domain-containing protein [Streptomyces sp. PSAA01]MCG0287147.1 helix-turn-helix domain-containing protein [Streptomyces sp. PSAA01]
MSEHQPTRYTIIGNHLTQHRELSLTAIGLGAHIQSLPDGVQVDIRTLAGRFPEGRARIAAALRELERHGYLERVRERTPEGRIVTRTFSYNAPEITRARRRAGETRPREGVRPPAPPPRTDPGSLAPAPPADAVPPAPPVPPPPPPAPVPVRTPAPPRPPATQADPAPSGTYARAATSLLAELRRDDDRLLLPERDVRRLAPAVTTWLERGATPEAVRRTLGGNLPPDLRHPAALLAHRLTALLPPPLPVAQPTPPRPALVPLQNCDGCDRAFRSPKPGLCRGCREPDAVTPTAA